MRTDEDASQVLEDSSTECPRRTSHHPYETVFKETHPHSFRHHLHNSSSSITASAATLTPRAPPTPPPPSQFVVEKQGRFEESLWHTRVLTLDAPRHRLYVSQSSKAAQLHHRCMARIDAVRMWPSFDRLRLHEDFHSDVAQRTVCIKGLVGVRRSSFFLSRIFSSPNANGVQSSALLGRFLSETKAMKAQEAEITAAQLATAKYLEPPLASVPSVTSGYSSSSSSSRRVKRTMDIANFTDFTEEVWLVRVMTATDLKQLACALRRTVPATCSLTGYHRAVHAASLIE